jgi:DNA-directed RNA polymerase specialized sigma24 family protein
MESQPTPKQKWTLTKSAFDLLLAQLDSDRQEAGTKYEGLRRKLVKFFEWRGCSFSEDLADETINRVARNLELGEKVRDLPAYCGGVARLVVLESLRARQQEQQVLRAGPCPSTPAADEADQRAECLEYCMRKLSPENSQLIVQYYQEDKQARIRAREGLAARLGIPLNALRIRTHRIRVALERCVDECMKRRSSERKVSADSFTLR